MKYEKLYISKTKRGFYFNVWRPLKAHTFLSEPAAESANGLETNKSSGEKQTCICDL